MRALRVKRSKGMADCMLTTTGKSLNTVRDLEVEGTSFNPDKGCVVGLTSLDKQLEVPLSIPMEMASRLRPDEDQLIDLQPAVACMQRQILQHVNVIVC